MKAELENKLIAVVRVRGRIGVRRSIAETLKRLNLKKPNNLILLYGTKSNLGMIMKCNDFVTYGEVSAESIDALLKKAGKASKDDVAAVMNGKKKADEVFELPFRLHPPRHGYEGIKLNFSQGGAMGYRGEGINKLIKRMT